MKFKRDLLVLIVVLGSVLAPEIILPSIGISTLRGDCGDDPGNPWAFNAESTNSHAVGVALSSWPYTPPTRPGHSSPKPTPPPGTYTNGDGGAGGGGGYRPLPVAWGAEAGGVGGPYGIRHITPLPANVADGSFVYAVTDLTVQGVTPLALTRVYVSNIEYNGPMGFDFDFSYNRSLDLQAGGAYYETGQGYREAFSVDTSTTGPDSYILTAHTNDQEHLKLTYFGSESALNTLIPLCSALSLSAGYVVSDPHGSSDVFDISGRLQYSVDRNGNYLAYTRDSIGRLIKVEDPVHGTYITFTLDDNGRITAATDSTGRTVSYQYDSYYNLKKVTYPETTEFPLGVTNQYTYDDDNRMSGVIDGNNNTVISNTYGAPGSSTEFSLATQTINGGTATFSYGTYIRYTDNKGFITDYYTDGNGNITFKVCHTASGYHSGEPSTYTTNWTYDSFNQLVSVIYPKYNTTSWTYDAYGDVLTVTNSAPTGATIDSTKGTQALSSATHYTYESRFHQIASLVDPNGKETDYHYGDATSNPAGNLLSITYPTTAAGTPQVSFTYNGAGQVLTSSVTSGTSGTPVTIVTQNTYDSSTGYVTKTINDYGSGKLNATTNYTYDSYGHVATVQDPNTNTTTITTNALNEVEEVDGPSGEVTQSSYDGNGQATTVQKKLGTSQWQKAVSIYNSFEQLEATHAYTDATTYLTTSYSYDANGNLTSVADPLGHSTSMDYDEQNRPYKKTDAFGNLTKTDFDPDGNVSVLTDEKGNKTQYVYDGLEALEQKTYANETYYETWTYDPGERLTSRRTAAGNTISYEYDNCNELTSMNYGSTITNAYDLSGQLLTSTEGGSSLVYAHDNLGRITSFTDQAGRTSTYTYDLDGNRLNATYPTGVSANVAYDYSSRPQTLKDGAGNTLATFSFDSLGRPTGLALGNGTTVTPSFDLINRVSSLTNSLASVSRNYSYTYDDASRISTMTEPRGTVSISSYSDRNEVKGITEPTGSPFADQSFTYDAAFNRSTWTVGSATPTSYTVNNMEQYDTVGGSTLTYNGDGGLTGFPGNIYVYDNLDRLTEVDYTSGKTLFSYDPFGRRVKKVDLNTSGTVLATYQYHYDGSAVAVEYRPSTTWTYYGGILRTDGTNNQYYYRDAQGSISAVADNSGNILEEYEYNAQGQFQITNGSGTVLSSTGIGNDLLYSGYRYDLETGNYYCNARYYNPTLGRFLSRDPLPGAEFSQGTNLYAYCGNDCANEIDPSGEDGFTWGYDASTWMIVPPSATPTKGGPNNLMASIEKEGIIFDVKVWNLLNVNKNRYEFFTYSCTEQSWDLDLFLNSRNYQCWNFSILSGGNGIPSLQSLLGIPGFGSVLTQNDVLVSPSDGNPLSPFTLDAYAGNNFWNSSGQVPVGTVRGFHQSWPSSN